LICTAHNLKETSRRDGPTWHKELLYRATDALADQTTIICKAGFDRYLRVGAVPRNRLMVIPNGIDMDLFTRSEQRRNRVRAAFGIGSEFVWLAVGRLVKQKDYPTLFRALAMMDRKDFIVLIAGSGPLEQELRRECARLGLDGCVRFCGTSEQIIDLYNAADAFVMSSKFEGLPMALLEAASLELPAVVTDVGGNAEIVVDGLTGYLVPQAAPEKLAAALKRLMDAPPDDRKAMGLAARKHCRDHYEISVIMNQWLDLYAKGMADRPRQTNPRFPSDPREEHSLDPYRQRAPEPEEDVMDSIPPISNLRSANQPCSVSLSSKEETARSQTSGGLVISLDFELQWGVRDIKRLNATQREILLATRAGVPRLLDLFDEFSIHATWATVGLLFAHSKKEAEAFRPKRWPNYKDVRLQPYLETTGDDERSDPFHFAPSLISMIAERKGQEIASHSFSHYYCMEPGQTGEDFEADLQSAVAIAANSGYKLRSYVFPRNQANPAYLPYLEKAGIWSYRGTEPVATKMAYSFAEQRHPHKRLARLVDSFVNVDGFQTFKWPGYSSLTSVPSSRYLRAYRPVFSPFERWLIERIQTAMTHAAQTGEIYHLWWHPEDFATNYDRNLRLLRHVLEIFQECRDRYGMTSLSMADVVSNTMKEQLIS
jgi:peptidoglycan/xylan/chitin deacetylase (PgdA/CDA1 family)